MIDAHRIDRAGDPVHEGGEDSNVGAITPPVWAVTIACSRDTRRDNGTGRRVTAVRESKSGVRQTAAACSTSCIVLCAVSTTMPSRLHSAMT